MFGMNHVKRDMFGGGAGGSAGNIQANAAKEAAQRAADGYQVAGDIAAQGATNAGDIYSKYFQEGQGYLNPYQDAGSAALAKYQALMGLGGKDQQSQAFADFQNTPGQQFARDQAEQSILRNASATGGLGGGNVQKALQKNAIGYANQDYNNYLANIGALTNIGYNASNTGANMNMQGGAQMAGYEQARANSLSQAELGKSGAYASGITNSAAASASGILADQQAKAGGISNAMSTIGSIAMLASDKNLKEDIKPLDIKRCYELVQKLPLKIWRYLESAGIDRRLHLGPMAQDAPKEIKVDGQEALNLHDELMLIAGALQYMHQNPAGVSK